MKLRLETGTLELSASNPDVGEASEDLEVAYAGDPITHRVQRPLPDRRAGRCTPPATRSRSGLTDEVGPGVLRGSQDPSYTYVLMPMRL